jgi:hypothetical protein
VSVAETKSRRKWLLGFIGLLLIPVAGFALLRVQSSKSPSPPAAIKNTEYKDDAVADLQRRLDSGAASLTYEPGRGYVRSLLKNLNIRNLPSRWSFLNQVSSSIIFLHRIRAHCTSTMMFMSAMFRPESFSN